MGDKNNIEKRRSKRELLFRMKRYDWANCSKVIQSEVTTLQAECVHMLGENLTGIYLHGSLALGGFQPARSDIDMIVTTREQMSVEQKRELIQLLFRVSKFPCPIDVWFLTEHDLIPLQQPVPFALHYSEAQREDYEQELRNDSWQHWNERSQTEPQLAIYLTVLHHKGICLVGRPIAEMFPVVSEQMFRDELIASFESSRADRLRDLIGFVLNACRTAAYLADKVLLAKDEGGEWGLTNLPEAFHPLIRQALALYRSDRLERPVSRPVLDEFTRYMEEAIAR